MKRLGDKNNNRRNVARVVTGILVGGVVGATVGLLMAPASGQEIRHGITSDVKKLRTMTKKAAARNVETRARQLAEAVNENAGQVKKTVTRRKKAASAKK